MQRLNISELDRLLHIPNPKDETIFGVIGRMDVLLDLFKKDKRYDELVPFLKTYYFVTKAAAERYIQKRHSFVNIREYETLDIYFASLYFKALHAYLTEGVYATPWKTYFDYCHTKGGIPFLQMILGINAHINADLYTALTDLHYTQEKDFFTVNDILKEVIPEVMNFMIFSEFDIFSAGSLVMKKFFASQFHTVIGKWRTQTWENAMYRKHERFTAIQNERIYLNIAQQTEQIGSQLIHDFESITDLPILPELIDALHGPMVADLLGKHT